MFVYDQYKEARFVGITFYMTFCMWTPLDFDFHFDLDFPFDWRFKKV